MKLDHKNINNKNGDNVISLTPQEQEDMWTIYNLLRVDDSLKATTIRRMQMESGSGTVSSDKVQMTLSIIVEKMEYDTDSCSMRVSGKVGEQNQFVKVGTYHTIELELNRKLSIRKDHWDSVQLKMVKDACDPNTSAEAAAVILHEGLATICLLRDTMAQTRRRIEMNIPKKRREDAGNQRDKTFHKFYEAIMKGMLETLDLDALKCIVLASPGFYKDGLYDYLFSEAVRKNIPALLLNKAKFIVVHASSGHKHALSEVLMDPAVSKRLHDLKAIKDTHAMDKFYKMLHHEPDSAFYGLAHVTKAIDSNAVDTLLISDALFRSKRADLRTQYVQLVDKARKNGATVLIFSSLHISGEQLTLLSGIAAILRYPLPFILQEDNSNYNLEEELESQETDLFYLMDQENSSSPKVK